MPTPYRAASALAGALLLLAPVCALATVTIQVKASQDDPVPGAPGFFFTGFGNPVVNDAGDLAFKGFVSDGVFTGWSGIFGPDASGEVTLVANDVDPVPGMPPDTEFRFVGTHFPLLSDAGRVIFRAGLSGPGISFPTDASGIWEWREDTGLALRVRAGDPLPELGAGVTLGPIAAGLAQPRLGPGDEIDFSGSFDPGLGTGASETAAFSVTASGEARAIASVGMSVPGVAGALFTYVGGPLPNLVHQRSVWGFFDGPGVTPSTGDGAFLWHPKSGLELLYRSGDQAPGLPAGIVLDGANQPVLNDAGELAFLANLTGPGVTEDNRHAIYGPDASGAVTLLARRGDPAPGTEAGTVFSEPVYDFVFNGPGQTAFYGTLDGPSVTPANAGGIFLFDPALDALTLLVRDGDPAPELPGVVIEGLSNPVLNDRGDLVVHTGLAGTGVTPDTDVAIFAFMGDGTRRKVVRTGDPIPFGPGDERALTGISMLTGGLTDVHGIGQLSDEGHVAFALYTATGSSMAVATLPEPTPTSGVLVGFVLLLRLERRRRVRRP